MKTIAAELEAANDLGLITPIVYDANASLPSQLAIESSMWFMEMLLAEKGPVQVN